VALIDADKTKLVATLKAQIGKDIQLSEVVDAATIGGMKLKVGGYQLDNTISGKLRAMRNALVDHAYESKL
jgi:F-type H+-transporting ATPase subunit delta